MLRKIMIVAATSLILSAGLASNALAVGGMVEPRRQPFRSSHAAAITAAATWQGRRAGFAHSAHGPDRRHRLAHAGTTSSIGPDSTGGNNDCLRQSSSLACGYIANAMLSGRRTLQ